MLRFDPFSELDAVTQGLVAAGREAGSPRSPRFMPMDLYQVDDHYVLTADLPGADPGSIDVDVENGVLTLTGRRTAMSDSGVRWLTSERFSGVYRRQLTLGESIDTAGIAARYDNGVLTVTIPIAERAKPRRIVVEQGSDEPQCEQLAVASGTADGDARTDATG
ncbi:Hsp20/alpha crystallin family protein [Tsukamurella tyrosinosolvens]|uniref:HSP20 family protein n=2 Tax=Tsukamurella tyrosinosolvens TaxID=57704 RepID=A0A1H4YLR0_TSUTY|nr:Hsp20/alpha crystallin family protein [Tsukamurella tyrosinosolvens]AUN41453.1 heat-shock protein Hsp20 [Tsukamurella tyrosinosolvens]KXP00393.1 heat-shock protein Hsp20 [Tsukamurella tyrosinosolvens]KXP04788.1 heat-shock protein Hsp20 [Tsukamurella tyrosinosolvens]KZL98042.1 heat-shock protein Hsp20 [Tsukamurella tyrosinosolvens]MCA4995311.1 Hsp20/alpha crystallin family protein [Tsukamurella tyrosinosolvens]